MTVGHDQYITNAQQKLTSRTPEKEIKFHERSALMANGVVGK